MVENPMTWGPAEKIISEVLDQQDNILPRIRPPQGEVLCGLSLEWQITDALRRAGLLQEEENAEKKKNSGTPSHQAHHQD